MSILHEIQSDLINPEIRLSDILRKVKVLAYKLNSDEFRKWVDRELDGYSGLTSKDIPPYRKGPTQSFGHFMGPFRAEIRNAPISPASMPEGAKDYPVTFNFFQGIRALESLAENREESIRFGWPPDNVLGIQDDVYEGYRCVQAWWVINKQQVEQLLDSVRNRLLSFTLELEAQGVPLPEEGSKPAPASENAIRQVLNAYILGDQNVVGLGFSVEQHTSIKITPADMTALIEYLQRAGVSKEDVDELAKAVAEDGPAHQKHHLGPRVKEWLGGMLAKAAAGTWQIATKVASEVLTKALFSYYGWG